MRDSILTFDFLLLNSSLRLCLSLRLCVKQTRLTFEF